MQSDIRLPIGGLFSLIGLLLLVYGIVTHASPMYTRSLDINVNLYWGFVMLVFGAAMLFLSFRSRKKA
jgi:uncharacterized membrane protein HdeD (DUF308 family)